MQLTNHLEASQVLVKCDETDKNRLLERMIDAVLSPRVRTLNPAVDRDAMRTEVLRCESERVNAVGDEMAFPHARVKGFSGLGLSLAVMRDPIDFGGARVRLICLTVVPEEAPMVMLKVMSRLAHFFRSEPHRRALLAAATGEEVVSLLSAGELSLDIPVTARDIMVAVDHAVVTDMPLRELARVMHARHVQAVAVVDGAGRLVGEVTADGLFQFGLPEFFQHLKSVSFISEFDPFEKYFEREAQSTAEQVLNPDVCRMRPEATLLEIVFALAVQRCTRVYVVDADGKWVGSVDRAAVLNNVING